MMSHALFLTLRLVHVIVGVMWVGAILFVALFLLPAVQAAGPAGGAVMQQLTQVRRVPTVMLTFGLITVLSGLTLYWNDSAGFRSKAWLASGTGTTFGLGAVFAIVAVVLGSTVNAPTAKKIGALTGAIRASGGPPSAEQGAELQRLQTRLLNAQRIIAVLLLLATTAMAVARYVR